LECGVSEIVVKVNSDHAAKCISVTAEGAQVSYHDTACTLSVTQFVKPLDVSVQLDEALHEHNRSIAVRLSGIDCQVFMGDVLLCCAEAVSQALLPFTSIHFHPPHTSASVLQVVASSVDDVGTPEYSLDGTCQAGDDAVNNAAQLDSSFRLSLHVPLVSLNVFTDLSARALGSVQQPDKPVFGVCLHEMVLERVQNSSSQISLLQIVGVTSAVEPNIQDVFISATAPTAVAADAPSTSAVYLRNEKLFLRRTIDVPGSAPSHKLSTIGRLHDFRLTLSSALLGILNEAMLAPVANGVSRVRCAADIWEVGKGEESSRRVECNMVDGNPADRMLLVSGDLCIRKDLFLGGRHGTRIRFRKDFSSTHRNNFIRVRSVQHARIFLSMVDLPQGPSQAPIVIDEGLTVHWCRGHWRKTVMFA